MILTTTLTNGPGEEVSVRAALHAALNADRAVVVSTAVYTVATAFCQSGGSCHLLRRVGAGNEAVGPHS